MRKTQFALLALSAAIVAVSGSISPASAGDYPWCAQGGDYDYPGECSYATYAQCQASVSGRLLFCGPNPRVAYGAPAQQRPTRYRKPVSPN